MPPSLNPSWASQHDEETWAPAGRARAGTHNAVLSHHHDSDVTTEESDAGPIRTRNQRRSTVGADFHRSSVPQPVPERHGLYTAAPLPPHMHQHPSHLSYQHSHPHPYAHTHPHHQPEPDSRRSSGQASLLHQSSPISNPSRAPSSQGSRSTTPLRVAHLAYPRSNEDGPEAARQAPPQVASLASPSAARQTPLPLKEEPPSTSSSKPSTSKPAPSASGPTGKGSEKPTDRRRRRKIPFSYSSLIAQAISSSPEGKMTLREIYAWIHWAYPDLYSFDGPDAQGWQNTVRHNLSLNKMFVKVPRSAVGTRLSDRTGGWGSVTFPKGKGGYWMLDSSVAGAPIALPGPQRGAPTSSFSAPGAPHPPPHPAPASVPAPLSAGQVADHQLARAELDARFQHSVNLYDRPRPYLPPSSAGFYPSASSVPYPPPSGPYLPPPAAPLGMYRPAELLSEGPGHAPHPYGGITGRRRAVTYNASVQGESDYAYANVYGAPYGAEPQQRSNGVEERPRARGYTTTAADVRDFHPMAYTDLRQGSETQATPIAQSPGEAKMQLDLPNLERRGERAKGPPARMSISGMLND